MSKLVIFCECYGQIEYVLQAVTHHYHDRPVTIVIPGFYDLFKLFKVFNQKVFCDAVDLIYLEPFQPRTLKARGINKLFHVIPDIIRERRYLKEVWNKYFAELAGCEVYFFSRGYSGRTFHLLKKLSKRNVLVYVSLASLGPSYWSKYTPTNIVDLAKLIVFKLIYGCDTAMGKLPYTKGFLYMPDRFMEKAVDRVIDVAGIDEMMKGFDISQFKVFEVSNYSVIYFDQDLIGTSYILDSDTFKRELASIFDILGKYFPKNEIAYKYHPEHDDVAETGIKVGDTLPAFIPAEFLYNDNVKLYLSPFSFSMANVEKGLAVSIADLISFKSDEIRSTIKEDLIQVSKSKILFPKSLDEFERILIDLKERRI